MKGIIRHGVCLVFQNVSNNKKKKTSHKQHNYLERYINKMENCNQTSLQMAVAVSFQMCIVFNLSSTLGNLNPNK